MQTLNLNNAEFLPHVCEFVNEGHKVTILARGNSMRPFIESDRDEVVLTRATQYNVGDIVLAEIQPGHYVLHRIDKIQNMALILHMSRGEFNRDSLFALEFHTVEQLRLHLALSNRPGQFEHAISKCRFTMVDVRNDAKISNLIYIHNNILPHCQ